MILSTAGDAMRWFLLPGEDITATAQPTHLRLTATLCALSCTTSAVVEPLADVPSVDDSTIDAAPASSVSESTDDWNDDSFLGAGFSGWATPTLSTVQESSEAPVDDGLIDVSVSTLYQRSAVSRAGTSASGTYPPLHCIVWMRLDSG